MPLAAAAEQYAAYPSHFEQYHLPSTSQSHDDIIFEKQVEGPNSKRSKTNDDVIELSSDDDDDHVITDHHVGFNGRSLMHQHQAAGWSPFDPHPRIRMHQEAQIKMEDERRRRKRRKSGDYDNNEPTTHGFLLVNAGKPQDDPDVFVADHLTNVLQPHQLGGVRFLYDNVIESIKDFKQSPGLGCILAHSMGLGKTIQVITFVDIFFRYTEGRKVLIVCPINVIQNWYNEFNKWMPEDVRFEHFGVYLLGDGVKGLEARAQLIDRWNRDGGVLLMGYEMFRILVKSDKHKQKKMTAKELREMQMQLADDRKTGAENKKAREEALIAALVDPGPDLVVCDEGHRIKNLKANIADALRSIRTRRRVVLTGYPLQNNLMEYFCMVDFVRPSFLGTRKNFATMFDRPIKNGQCIDSTARDVKVARQRTHVLVQMLRGFVQRRTQHILKKILPESKEYVVLLRKSPVQHALYRSFVLYASDEIREQNANFFNPLKAFAICSKIWNHPDLLFNAYTKKKSEQRQADQPAFDDSFLGVNQHHSNGVNGPGLTTSHSTPSFSETFMCAPEGYNTQAQSGTSVRNFVSGSQLVQDNHAGSQGLGFNGNYGNPASHPFNANFMQQQQFQAHQQQPCYVSDYAQSYRVPGPYTQSNSYWPRFEMQCPPNSTAALQCLPGSGWSDDPSPMSADQQWSNGSSSSTQQSLMSSADWTGPPSVSASSSSVFDDPGPRAKTTRKPKQTLATALYGDDERWDDNTIRFDWAESIMSRFDTGHIDNSYKMRVAIGSILTLDLFENFLTSQMRLQLRDSSEEWKKNVTYCRFDGSTSGVDREKMINRFNEDPGLHLFLISTRAGSLGVNLVSASRVIIFDASWNPCHDAQAVCRIYRYGQQKKTFIYRLIMNNSMEKAIFNRQISKHGLQQRVVDEQNIDANVTTNEIENLLAYDESQDVVTGDWDVSTWEVEDELLLNVAREHSNLFAEPPFLHESLMLEREEGLSREEKLEAELLYNREKNGVVPSEELLDGGSSTTLGELLSSIHRRPSAPGYSPALPYPTENFMARPLGMLQRVHHPSPLPKSLELARFQNPALFHPQANRFYAPPHMALPDQNRMPPPAIVRPPVTRPLDRVLIEYDITLPSLNEKPVTLRQGDNAAVFRTSNRVYLRTNDGYLLDATGTIYDRRPTLSDEVIELD
ncbi:SNF2-related [Aphelenchoides avenae]|nr:SNF2-related [Aphelenchus avenae]